MIEKVIRFGHEQQLVGILSRTHSIESEAPVLLLFNAGVLHKVGPFRLWVDLARRTAKQGGCAFRFDIQGVGESTMVDELKSETERNVNDIQAAMDLVEKELGVRKKFVIVGLCSGADQAHVVAKLDPRVVGIVFMDGYGYQTEKYHVNHTLKRATSLRRWRNLARRQFSKGEDVSEAAKAVEENDNRFFPSVDEVQDDINQFLVEGRRLAYIYTAGVPQYYNYADQFWDMFPKLKPHKNLSHQYYDETDHTFALVAERTQVMDQIMDFLRPANDA